MTDFWLSCGHHLLDRDAGGGLLVTDEFLKAYLARPELAPPPDACIAERTLHAALFTNPRRPVAASEIAAIADADARENWGLMVAFATGSSATGPWRRPISISCAAAWGRRRRCSCTSSCT